MTELVFQTEHVVLRFAMKTDVLLPVCKTVKEQDALT